MDRQAAPKVPPVVNAECMLSVVNFEFTAWSPELWCLETIGLTLSNLGCVPKGKVISFIQTV
jgi:hypothetical protein